jgi:hypothetical protein
MNRLSKGDMSMLLARIDARLHEGRYSDGVAGLAEAEPE